MIGRIHSTETFGTVDGPGIRYVVFMQGCPMRCMYCHNPDTWTIGAGREVTVDDLMTEYDGCKEFYTGGGITVTGGEPLMQIEFLTEFFTTAKLRGIHTCIDTSGIVFNRQSPEFMEKIDKLLALTDLVMLDIKHINNEEHLKLCKQPNTNILDFATYLSEINKSVWLRHVVVPGITDNPTYLAQLGEFLATLNNIRALDVLPYHTMGVVKYEKLGYDYPLKGVPPLSKAEAIKARDIIVKAWKKRRKELKEAGKV